MAIDASITGTPLGAITGSVTNADDGTINGTIGFVATGTISSTMGVPGPAGSPGATGPQGPQGIPGPPGEGGTWGSIVGDIEDQVDLWSELGSKYPASNPSGFITASALSPYLTTATANATFQTLAGMSSYLTTSAAAAGYYPLTGNPSGFLTAASLSGYATESWVTGQGYITSAALTGYAPLASPVFTGDARAVTAALGDNDTSIATTAFVQQELLSGTANARNLEVYVRNQTGSTIPAGSIVYINGATGNRPTITLAQANNDANSAQTFGFTKASIANNGFGFVIVRGELENINTSALTEGVQLYLSPTTAGTWTTTKPSAPQHLVYVGICVRAHPTQGTILVAVQNGYELEELHDVSIVSKANNDLLAYESSTNLWKNKSFGTLGLLTSSSLTGYATESWVTAGFYPITGNPSGFITSSALTPYLTSATAASTYAALAGATFTGEVVTPASTTSNAGLTITPGVAPSAPQNGEIWATTNDLQIRLNGVTETLAEQSWVASQGYLGSAAAAAIYAPLSGATFTGLVSTLAPTTATAGLRLPHGSAPTTPVNGDLFTTTSGLFARINGSTRQYVDLDGTQTINGAKTFSNASQTLGNSTAAGTINIGTGVTVSGSLRTINIGTQSAAGSNNNINIGGGSGTTAVLINGPTTLGGTTNGVTVAADTNSVALATTAFVVGQAGSATPLVDGTAAVGTSLRYARQDHVHPTDTSRAATASPTFTGTPLSTTAAVDTNTTQIATTAFVVGQAASATPSALGTAAVGTSLRYARADHVHANPLPTGGTTAQVLSKVDGTNYNVQWTTVATGGGTWGSITGTLSSQTDLQSALNAKLDSTTAASTYQTISGMSFYLTTAAAATTYYPLTGNPSGFLTSAPVTSVAGRTGAITLSNTDISGLGTMATATAADYSTTTVANGLYYPLTGNPSGFLTSAPVTSVAGRTGAVTLSNTDISGLGTMATAAAADYALLAGATFTGKVNTPASTTTAAGLNLPHGTAPTTPVNGDIWTTTGNILWRRNGGTQTIPNQGTSNTFSAGAKQTVSHSSTTAGLNIGPVAGDPSSLANGDVWLNSTTNALNARVNGASHQLNTVKAWVNFNGTGTVAIRAALNVSSITDNGVGDYTVNFTTAMVDANYAALVTAKGIAAGGFGFGTWLYTATQTTSAVRVSGGDLNSLEDFETYNAAIFR